MSSTLCDKLILVLVLVLMIFYDSFKVNLSQGPQCILVQLWNHARSRSWNQPILSNDGKVSCSLKQRDGGGGGGGVSSGF